jgi:uncharacterized protein YybS (DUF2232 family)
MSDFLEKDTDPKSDNLPDRNSEYQSGAIASRTAADRTSPNAGNSDKNAAATAPLRLVETAFLASTASLIWLVNYYFPLGPLLRVFFPIPIALVYLRWGNRASWMSALVSGLLLSVLMGPTRSILYVIPFGIMGVLLGGLWNKKASWSLSVGLGAILGSIGFFFRFWLLSALLGQDLWVYVTVQVTQIVDWVFVKLGILSVPSLTAIGAIATGSIVLNNIIYLFVVHLVALLLLDRLGNPIPRPPHWVQVLIEYEE